MSFLRHYEKGQSMVLVLVFLTVLMLSLLVFFNISQVSRKKIEVQNAADAVAYSASVLEARHLNFTAFTNRAMIANEVGIAQTIGFTSWFIKWSNTFVNLGWWANKILNPIPFVGPVLAGVVQAAFKAVGTAIDAVADVSATFASVFAKLVSQLNPFYGYSQLGFRYATYDSILAVSGEIVETNAPGAKIATMSKVFSLYHAYMFNKYNVGYKPAGSWKGTAANDEKGEQREGMRRMAAAVNSSRDGWSRDRNNDMLLFDENYTTNIWPLGKFGFGITFGLNGEGGSTLRFIADVDSSKVPKEYYNWSSMDTEEFKAGMTLWLFDQDFSVAFGVPMGQGTMQMAHDPSSGGTRKLFDGPVGGYKQNIAGWLSEYGGTWDSSLVRPSMGGGNSFTSVTASAGFNPYDGSSTKPDADNEDDYGDLAPYHDINPEMEEPPPFVVWVTAPKLNDDSQEFDISTSDNMGANRVSTTGSLELDNPMVDPMDVPLPNLEPLISSSAGVDNPGIQAIAAGEVYYKRVDGEDEAPNSFSPYWHARLAPINQNYLFAVMATQDVSLAWAFTGGSQILNETVLTAKVNEFMSEGLNIGNLIIEDVQNDIDEAVEEVLNPF